MSRTLLLLKNIMKSYRQGDKQLDILKGASLAINEGETVALVGESGCGKSTLLHIAGLLESCDSGEIFINGRSCEKMSDNQRTMVRRHEIGVVYQSHHLLPEFTALENVVIPQRIAGISAAEARRHACEVLDYLKLSDRLHHRPSQLSGGEQQRVAIARAVVNKPSVLLADEPTGNLDPQTSKDVFRLLLKTSRGIGLGLLLVTHDIKLAEKCDRIIGLKGGQLVRKQRRSK
jgi:lipoprotein-releasing system ATP-binding protein